MSIISGPVPPYSNVPIQPQYYAPWNFVISDISLGETTTVTVTVPSITTLNYVIGQQVRLTIPPTFGCRQLNGVSAYITSVNLPDQVVLNLNSLGGNPYIASSATTPAQITAIGDIVSGALNMVPQSMSTIVPGSFINISPN